MILTIHVPGAAPYHVGDEIWQQPLHDAIRAEAQTIADDVASDTPEFSDPASRDKLRAHVTAEMTRALVRIGDSYRAPDGVLYSLQADAACEQPTTIPAVHHTAPTVAEVLRFENLPLDALASRRAIVRWSDDTHGEALRWYADEILITEGDLLGKTADQLRALHYRRDRDWLQT
jgi:hypothetical protein